jgi:hypothetical protein
MYKNYKDPIKRSSYMKKYSKEWRENNKDKIKEYNRIYMQKYREDNKEKISLYKKSLYKNNPQKYLEYSNKNRYKYIKSPKSRFSKYKYGAKSRGYNFDLDFDNFTKLLSGQCHYCGSKENIGIDRMDNKIGYTIKNCVSCCTECNFFKGSKEYTYFIEKCKSISYFVVNNMRLG